MKKRFKITVEINTDTPPAKKWGKIEDYIDNEIDEAMYYVPRRSDRNYSVMRKGTSIKEGKIINVAGDMNVGSKM